MSHWLKHKSKAAGIFVHIRPEYSLISYWPTPLTKSILVFISATTTNLTGIRCVKIHVIHKLSEYRYPTLIYYRLVILKVDYMFNFEVGKMICIDPLFSPQYPNLIDWNQFIMMKQVFRQLMFPCVISSSCRKTIFFKARSSFSALKNTL